MNIAVEQYELFISALCANPLSGKSRQYDCGAKPAVTTYERTVIDELVKHVDGYLRGELLDRCADAGTALDLSKDQQRSVIHALIAAGRLIVISERAMAHGDPVMGVRVDRSYFVVDRIRVSPQTWIETVG